MGLRSALLSVFRRIVRIYFREIEVAGEVPPPNAGGRLFAANHVNGLVDPILVLTQAPCAISPVAKSTLWKIPGLRWLLDAAEAVPIVRRRDVPEKSASDNEAVFARVAHHLGAGGNILIFPEGTSHNEPHLLALRSGAGRMLARARAENGDAGLTFQAVALEFDDREVFRSRALLVFGPVRTVRESRESQASGDAAVLAKEITDVIEADLSELLVEGKTWEERVLIVRVAQMFAEEARDRSLEQMNRLGRRIERARRVLAATAAEDVRAIEHELSRYFATLEDAETDDAAVARAGRGEADADPGRASRAAIAIATLPLALVAVVLYGLPYQVPRFVARRLKGDPDVTSTYKLGVGLVVYPVWAAVLVTLAILRLSPPEAALAIAVALASPFAALPWLDRWDRIAARASLLGPTEERRERLARLAEERAAILRELTRLADHADRAKEADGASAPKSDVASGA